MQATYLCNPQTIMCDEQDVKLETIQHSPATEVPIVMLPKVEEIVPSLKETMVSILCLRAQKTMQSSCYYIFMTQPFCLFLCIGLDCSISLPLSLVLIGHSLWPGVSPNPV